MVVVVVVVIVVKAMVVVVGTVLFYLSSNLDKWRGSRICSKSADSNEGV